MVRESLDAVDIEKVRHLLDLLAAKAIDNSGLPWILTNKLYNVLLGIGLVADLIVEVRTIERRLEDPRIRDSEVLQNITLDLRGSSSCKGDYRGCLNLLDD